MEVGVNLPIAALAALVADSLPGVPWLGATAFGIFSGGQVSNFDRFFGFFSLCHFCFPIIYFGLFVFGSVTPKGSLCPPLTSFSGIRSSRRINLSLVRFRLLFSESSADALFLFLGVFTSALC
jgi:hypothetical protein